MTKQTATFRKGMTLFEGLLASAILAMAALSLLMPFTAAAQNQSIDARRTTAAALAQELMEEIISKPFDDPDGTSYPGPEYGESLRKYFDNIDDYHGYSDGLDQQIASVVSMDGRSLDSTSVVGLSRHVTVDYVYLGGQDMSVAASFVRAKVEVKYRGDSLVVLTRLVYRPQ